MQTLKCYFPGLNNKLEVMKQPIEKSEKEDGIEKKIAQTEEKILIRLTEGFECE
jgi:hypothetical protein